VLKYDTQREEASKQACRQRRVRKIEMDWIKGNSFQFDVKNVLKKGTENSFGICLLISTSIPPTQ
jgi:hypothetical protein